MPVGFVSVSRMLDTALIILRNQIKGWDRAIRFRAEGSWSLPLLMAVLWLSRGRVIGLFKRCRVSRGT
jgi:hypothetical protein